MAYQFTNVQPGDLITANLMNQLLEIGRASYRERV